MIPRRWRLLALTLALIAAAASAQSPQAQPRYAAVLEAELHALELAPSCVSEEPSRYVCRYLALASPTERSLPARAVYSDETDTVEVFIEGYLSAPPADARTPTLLRRMMELNWQMLVGKLQWNPVTGEVRLGAVLSTDSNFDRRAFRSLVRTLDTLSVRHRAELTRL